MFGVFDARDADASLITALSEELGWTPADVRRQLDRCVMLENRAELEKYLIHDTWGHVWQAYLTDCTRLYDHLATMQFPISADYQVTTHDNDVLCLADCFYLHYDGRVSFDEDVAERFIHTVLEERVQALLASICAELTADIVEYSFSAQRSAAGADVLPSSSLFGDNPTKLDFAWADMQYFARAVRRPIRRYLRSESLRATLDTRLVEILTTKYPRHKNQHTTEEIAAAVDGHVTRFLDMFCSIQDTWLDVDLGYVEISGTVQTNIFTRMLTNLLRIQYVVNDIFTKHLAGPEHAYQRQCVLVCILQYFTQDPAKRFWSLDEDCAQWLLPLVKTLKN